MHAPCIQIPAKKSHMQPVTCKIFSLQFLSRPSPCVPFLSFDFPFLAYFLASLCVGSLPLPLGFDFLLSKTKVETDQKLIKSCYLFLKCLFIIDFYCLFLLFSSFLSFSFIFSLFSLAFIFLSLHLPFLLFSFISSINCYLFPFCQCQ